MKKIIIALMSLLQFAVWAEDASAGNPLNTGTETPSSITFTPIIDTPGQDDSSGCAWYSGRYGMSIQVNDVPEVFFNQIIVDAYWTNYAESIHGKGIGGYSFSPENRCGLAMRLRKDTGGLIKYGGDTYIHYDFTTSNISRYELIPTLEVSSYRGVVEFPVDGWKTTMNVHGAVGAGFSPTLGCAITGGIWKTIGDKLVLSVEGNAGIPVSGYQEQTSVFTMSYPGVYDISCDWFLTCAAGVDLISDEIFSAMGKDYFLSVGLHAHAGYIDPTRTQGAFLPFALDLLVNGLVSQKGTLQRSFAIIGLGYAFDGTTNFGRKNSTVKLFSGLNY